MKLRSVMMGQTSRRRYIRGCLLLSGILAGLISSSCLGPVRVRDARQSTIVEVDRADKLTQRVGVVLAHAPQNPMGQKAGERFMTAFLEAVRHENRRLTVVSEKNDAYPDALNVFEHGNAVVDVFDIADIARRKGYQGFAVVRVIDMRAYMEDTGIFWWRKSRHFISFVVSAELYDPFTAAKMLSTVTDEALKISPSDYQRIVANDVVSIKKLNKMIENAAEDIGEQMAECMAGQPWKTTVLGIDDGAVILAAGGRSGLIPSDRLDVYEARRVMSGLQGERFIVPGYKVGQVRVESMEGRFVRAVIEGQADIKVGDLVMVADN